MSLRITQVDAFTDCPFAGNPAAVCLLPAPADPRWMQDVAREMNLSETAFLVPQTDGFELRWFTPAVEVDLCGHATLASAHVLWEDGHLAPNAQARFHTRSGLLTADRRGAWIELDFPATRAEPAAAPGGLTAALGVTPRFVGRSRFDYLSTWTGKTSCGLSNPTSAPWRAWTRGGSSSRAAPPPPGRSGATTSSRASSHLAPAWTKIQ
jgi:predicted PhzF superfamily epimerase YddE/YHI9